MKILLATLLLIVYKFGDAFELSFGDDYSDDNFHYRIDDVDDKFLDNIAPVFSIAFFASLFNGLFSSFVTSKPPIVTTESPIIDSTTAVTTTTATTTSQAPATTAIPQQVFYLFLEAITIVRSYLLNVWSCFLYNT